MPSLGVDKALFGNDKRKANEDAGAHGEDEANVLFLNHGARIRSVCGASGKDRQAREWGSKRAEGRG